MSSDSSDMSLHSELHQASTSTQIQNTMYDHIDQHHPRQDRFHPDVTGQLSRLHELRRTA